MNNSANNRRDVNDELVSLRQQIEELTQMNTALQNKLDWFQRQVFGRKSEKRQTVCLEQGTLFGFERTVDEPPSKDVEVPGHARRKKSLPGTPADSGLRFDESRVPVKTIEITPDELKGPDAADYQVVRMEATYRLAQRPASYVVLKYVRPILKHTPTKALISIPAPANVLDKSFADVSFLAAMIIDKCVYHLPLYRQHQRILAAHIDLSRATLTHLVGRAAALLEPIAHAVLRSILLSHVLAMDETPVKAGRKKDKGAKHGQMKTGYYWPLYGDKDEVYFSFAATRGASHIMSMLSEFKGTLISDGYSAYASYIAKVDDVTAAQCWSHARRPFEYALDNEPELANVALDFIGAIYANEKQIGQNALEGGEKLAYRTEHSLDIVDRFMTWCEDIAQRPELIAMESEVCKAARYVLARRTELKVFLEDPAVPLDTNHLERTLRVIPMGKKNWLFCWTELGAHRVGILQTLLTTCKLQGVDPYAYLVDVLQRIDRHPARDIEKLTPRLWKEHYADQPLRSDIDFDFAKGVNDVAI